MSDVFRQRLYRHGQPIHQRVEGALLNAGIVLVTLLVVLILFFGVFASRAS